MKKVVIDGVEYVPVEKPKALLADAKVGWICRRRDGNYVQMDGIPPETLYYEAGGNLYYPEGNLSLDREDNLDIISVEPLAPEGSAEWAWQMLNLLGLPIYHPAEGVLTIPVPYSSERFAHCYAKTGWYIHEPVQDKRYYSCLFYEEGARTAIVKYLSASQIDRIIAIMDEGENA